MKHKPQCPRCKSSENVVGILYGMPGMELAKKHEKGLVKLGGCEVHENSRRRYCKSCETRFGSYL